MHRTDNGMVKPGKTGLPRLLASAEYSMRGLRAAFRYEEAFRLELTLALLFMPLAFVVGSDLTHTLVLLICCGLVLLAELLNSAIEAVVDRISAEQHPLSGQAKDIGSAAVFVSLLLFILIWGLSLWQFFASHPFA